IRGAWEKGFIRSLAWFIRSLEVFIRSCGYFIRSFLNCIRSLSILSHNEVSFLRGCTEFFLFDQGVPGRKGLFALWPGLFAPSRFLFALVATLFALF
ncbi:hypothetical protein, partial [uncultured Rummeliibacillus sp.]|uniref:hypothetical protein n=1 Tax=uncultured Rummeliibacillus sp. TaxID=762292 RepID=UPI00260FD46F